MARPKAADKRRRLLDAAIELIGEQGLGASTAKIAQRAAVSEGSLFTYFRDKDDLLNQTYLDLRARTRAVLLDGFPSEANLESRAVHLWDRLVEAGVAHPVKRKATNQLVVSERITPATRQAARMGYEPVAKVLSEMQERGALRDVKDQLPIFLLLAIADSTVKCMEMFPEQAAAYRTAGFRAFWNAVTNN